VWNEEDVMHHRVSLRILALAVGVITLLPVAAVGQTTTQDVTKKATAAWEAMKDYTVERKNDAVAYGKKLMSDFDGKYLELEKKAASATGEAKTKSEQQLKALKDKRAQAAKKLDELGKASGQTWDKVRNDFTDAYRELSEQYDKLVAALRK
jgi:arylsulfatase A-like enzyme